MYAVTLHIYVCSFNMGMYTHNTLFTNNSAVDLEANAPLPVPQTHLAIDIAIAI